MLCAKCDNRLCPVAFSCSLAQQLTSATKASHEAAVSDIAVSGTVQIAQLGISIFLKRYSEVLHPTYEIPRSALQEKASHFQ